MTAATKLRVEPVTSAVGAVVDGVDMSAPLDGETVRLVRQALLDHGVIFFHNQDVTAEQLRAFAENFGHVAYDNGAAFFQGGDLSREKAVTFVEKFGTPDGDSSGKTELVAEFNTGGPKRRGQRGTDLWHSDTTGVANPPLGTVLRAVTLPPVGGDTLWSSMYAAYEALSPTFQEFLDGLTAAHSMLGVIHRNGHNVPFADSEVEVIHPVVKVHPETGKKALYVNEAWTTRICELDPAESTHVLALLFEHVKSPDFFLRWRWTPNDVAFWDNRAVQHYAVRDYEAKRDMMRIIIQG
jgi:alpha-ketoglutarate-dependent taurine dioxygenase